MALTVVWGSLGAVLCVLLVLYGTYRDAGGNSREHEALSQKIDTDIDVLHTDMNTEFKAVRTEMNAGFEAVRADMTTKFKDIHTILDERLPPVSARNTR